MSDAEAFVPRTEKLTIEGADVMIRVLTIGQIMAITKLLKGVDLSAGFTLDQLPDLMAAHGDKLIELIAIALGKDGAWVEALSADHFLEIAAIVIEVNQDFFVRRLVPILESISSRVQQANGTLPTASNS